MSTVSHVAASWRKERAIERWGGGGKFSPRPVCFGVDTLTLFSALPAISAQPKTTHKQQ